MSVWVSNDRILPPADAAEKKHYARNQSFDEPTRIGIQLKVHVLRSILSAFL